MLTRGQYGNKIVEQPGAWFGDDSANERIAENAKGTPSWDGWYPVAKPEDGQGMVAWDDDFGWMHV